MYYLLCILALFLVGISCAKEVELTNIQGKALKVKLVGADEEQVEVLILSNRRNAKIKLATLSHESLELIEEWKKEGGHLSTRFKVDYKSGKTDRPYKRGSYDDDYRQITLSPTVEIANDDFKDKASRPVEMVVVIIGRPAGETNKLYLLGRERFEVPSLPARESKSFELEDIETTYYRDNGYYSGYRYVGYAIYLVSEGEVIEKMCTPSAIDSRYGNRLMEEELETVLKPD